MNKKRKILTLVALVVFGAIIALHYINLNGSDVHYWNDGKRYFPGHEPQIEDVRMPVFVLAVFYAGLFALLGNNKTKGTVSPGS
jgi:hypothetical protein